MHFVLVHGWGFHAGMWADVVGHLEGADITLVDLGFVGEPYREGTAGKLAKAAKGLSVAGAALTAVAGRRRAGAVAGATLVLAGGMCLRWAVYKAGFQSARDPRYTVAPQRRRLESAQG